MRERWIGACARVCMCVCVCRERGEREREGGRLASVSKREMWYGRGLGRVHGRVYMCGWGLHTLITHLVV